MATTQLTLFGSNARQIKPYVVNLFSNNNNVDRLEFQMENYNQGNVDLSTLDAYAICYGNEFLGGLDEVKLESEVTADGKLKIYWDLTLMTLTDPQTIQYQIVFKSNEGQVWTSHNAIIFANGSLTADEEIVAQYPTILKQMETRIEVKTEEATQGAVEEITGTVADTVNNAMDQINNIAGNFDAGVIYIPFGEHIPVEMRIYNRLYYQYTNAENTKGRFEDYMGNVLVAEGSGGGGGGSSLPMFAHIWSDVLYNDASYLRADTFSWHNADIYVTAYEHLLKEYNNENCVEKTEQGVTYKLSPNGFKIANADQHDNVRLAYEDGGSAWFYLLDTENERFKLPRENAELVTTYPRTAPVTVSDLNIYGNGMTLGLTDGTGTTGLFGQAGNGILGNYTLLYGEPVGSTHAGANYNPNKSMGVTTDPTKSGITGDGTGTANLPTPTTERVDTDAKKYLYFYVGEYEREQTEINIGAMTELTNDLQAQVVSLNGEITSLSEQVVALQSEINTMLGRMDFANAVEVRLDTTTTSYTVPSDGYIQFSTTNANSGAIYINDAYFCHITSVSNGNAGLIPVTAGDVLSTNTESGWVYMTFIPQKGV